jgi:hypothetical protein
MLFTVSALFLISFGIGGEGWGGGVGVEQGDKVTKSRWLCWEGE